MIGFIIRRTPVRNLDFFSRKEMFHLCIKNLQFVSIYFKGKYKAVQVVLKHMGAEKQQLENQVWDLVFKLTELRRNSSEVCTSSTSFSTILWAFSSAATCKRMEASNFFLLKMVLTCLQHVFGTPMRGKGSQAH